MIESQSCEVRKGQGLVHEDRPQSKRQITLLSADKWATVCEEIDEDLPWIMRRANLLVEGVVLSTTIGKKIRVGAVQIQIHSETKPCELMDYLHKGLRKVMKPACRGGVYGEVLENGIISVGDRISVCDD